MRPLRIIRTLAPVLAAGLVMFASPVSGTERTLEIRIAEEATIHGDTVTLGAIAAFEPAGDPRVARLEAMEVASAPAPGSSYQFNRHFLDYKVGSALGDRENGITLEIPSTLVIHRAAQVITSARMKEIFREYLIQNAPWSLDEMVVEDLQVPGDLALPEGNLRWDIRENGNTDYLGNLSATLTFLVDGRAVRRAPVSARIAVTQHVVQASRNIQRGDAVRKDDLRLVRQTTTRRTGDALTSLEEAAGKKAARSIRVGRTLTAAMVEDPPVVEKGSAVTIVAENEILRITTRGEALEDGCHGDRIRVRNLQSGKEIFSTVEAPGWVRVRF
ncbi:MAG: flagellar basal body P-ring formation chaperone FlgA [Desulfobacteraceae bacterium]